MRPALYSAAIALTLVILSTGCSRRNPWAAYDPNADEPPGEPAFTSLGKSYVIDNAHVLSEKTIAEGDAICRKLQADGVAEMVVLVQTGVHHPEDYATHYGRWLRLGKPAPADQGGQNGFVWLVRPDAAERMTFSVGRGLPQFSAVDGGEVTERAKDFFAFNNFDMGVLTLIKETDKKLRAACPARKGE